MLAPRKVKFRKSHRLRSSTHGKMSAGSRAVFGNYGLKTIEGGEISGRQIEAARRAMTHFIKRGGKIWIRIFPHKPVTQKAAEVPMGSGKGTVEKFVADVRAGTMLFEMDGVDLSAAKEAMRLASQKLPVKCRFVTNK